MKKLTTILGLLIGMIAFAQCEFIQNEVQYGSQRIVLAPELLADDDLTSVKVYNSRMAEHSLIYFKIRVRISTIQDKYFNKIPQGATITLKLAGDDIALKVISAEFGEKSGNYMEFTPYCLADSWAEALGAHPITTIAIQWADTQQVLGVSDPYLVMNQLTCINDEID